MIFIFQNKFSVKKIFYKVIKNNKIYESIFYLSFEINFNLCQLECWKVLPVSPCLLLFISINLISNWQARPRQTLDNRAVALYVNVIEFVECESLGMLNVKHVISKILLSIRFSFPLTSR